MTFNIITLGCKVNRYESQYIFEKLVSKGYVPSNSDIADIIIINSCSVTSTADSKNRKTINRARRENPNSVIILTGCMPQAFADKSELFNNCDIVLGNSNKKELIPRLEQFLKQRGQIVDIPEYISNQKFDEMTVNNFHERTRAFVKIEDGCNRFCSYCIIPYARGRVRSKSLEALYSEIKTLSANGYKEVVLVGINLSAYGQDIDSDLSEAVQTVCSVDGIERVRLSSLEPEMMTPDVLQKFANQKKFCPHFHLSLQSGCDATLKRMHRHYTSEEYKTIVNNIRRFFDNPSITTDIMVGFAGETDKEFSKSLSFAQDIGFAKVHVFSYSRRQGTIADKMPDQVDEHTKAIRSKCMINVTDKTRKDFLISQIGRVEQVLFEVKNIKGYYEGYTMNYTPVYVKSDNDISGKLFDVRITQAFDDYCLGTIV